MENGLSVGSRIALKNARGEVVEWEVVMIEEGSRNRRAECDWLRQKELLERRPLNRYYQGALVVGDFQRGDMIVEEWERLRAQHGREKVNVYTKYHLRKDVE